MSNMVSTRHHPNLFLLPTFSTSRFLCILYTRLLRIHRIPAPPTCSTTLADLCVPFSSASSEQHPFLETSASSLVQCCTAVASNLPSPGWTTPRTLPVLLTIPRRYLYVYLSQCLHRPSLSPKACSSLIHS